MEPTIDHTTVKGWGIDADDRNEPTYPMKNYTGDDHQRLGYERPDLQITDGTELHSNERPSMSAVFGTTVPPSGLSGALRRYAFRYSEGHYLHWLLLIFADRINVLEGIGRDITTGHLPNIYAEKGSGLRWKYEPREMTKKLVITVAIGITLFTLLRKKRKSRRLFN